MNKPKPLPIGNGQQEIDHPALMMAGRKGSVIFYVIHKEICQQGEMSAD